jgi:Amt family ammonium transporter
MVFQCMFAVITPALITGAFAERISFRGFLLFSLLWTTLIYDPLAHWVWGVDGWLHQLGALDFAGGTVVHISSGFSALAAVLMIGRRRGYPREPMLPNNLTLTITGAGLLWFGWFGFNAGSALGANSSAALAFATTMLAPAATLMVWTVLDLMRTGRVTAVGGATGIVVGLVAITPAAGFVSPMGAIVLGAIAAFPSYFALLFRARTRLDDSLDVVAAHGLGGAVGALLTGVFADKAWNGVTDGLLQGHPGQLGVQLLAVVVVMIYSGTATFLLLKLIGAVLPLRADFSEEGLGMDVSQHGEEAYADGEGAVLILPDRIPRPSSGGSAAHGGTS